MISPRVDRLLAALAAETAACGSHRVLDAAEQAAFLRLAQESFAVPAASAAEARAGFLAAVAERLPVVIRDDELIVGSQRFVADTGHGNVGHIVVDYGRFLTLGVDGMKAQVAAMPAGANQRAFARALDAFSTFILRHAAACAAKPGFADAAAVCRKIAGAAPDTFREAVQLLWFIQLFLHAEGTAPAVSFGRLDQFLLPYLRDPAEAREILACLFLKSCEGDESQNLTLGGRNAAGANEENALSLLCLEVMEELGVNQPSLTVRFHDGSSARFRDAAARLALCGRGQPSFLNDPVVVAGLMAAGIPAARAHDFGIVGCYEATPQGDACPLTVVGEVDLPAVLLDYLAGTPAATDFPALLAGLKAFFARWWTGPGLAGLARSLDDIRIRAPSPFESVCVRGCIESGRCAEEGGAVFTLGGVNVMGLGTLVDSLAALKRLVYDERRLTLAAFLAQVRADFPDPALAALCRGLPEKFGRDEPVTNGLAGDLSAFIAGQILASRPGAVRPYPGFFRFGLDIITGRTPATPDGRRAGERVSYGCGPAELPGLEATAVLKAAAHVAHAQCACGNPLKLNFRRGDLTADRFLALLDGYFKLGGMQLHVNLADAAELRDAQARPAAHPALNVRISGFSALFTKLDRPWQDAVIARTENGL